MPDISRSKFLKLGAAAIAGPTLFDLATTGALAAKTPLAPAIDLKTLAKKAQAEGGTCLAYLGSADLASAFADGFKAAYPWATLNTVVSSTGAILSKVLTEVSAGKGADVYSSTPAQPYLYIRGGAVKPVLLANDPGLGANQDKTGNRHPYAQNVQVLAVNPSLAGYVPTDIFEFSKPAFKGQLAFDRPDNLGTGALFLASHRGAWGDKKWMQWLQGLHDNNVFVTSSATASYQAALTGERGIAADSIGDILSQAAGAPVKPFFYSAAPPYIQSLMLSSYAANPYTAQLFMNWVISKTGQQVVVGTGRTPAMDLPGAATAVSTLIPKGKPPIAPYSSIAGFVYNPAPYTKLFDQLWPS